MPSGFIVTKEDWEHMTPGQQSWMTFNAVQTMNARLTKLENRRWFNSGCAVVGGAIGGFVFSLLKSIGR
jgi:hypothetical protein